MTLLNVYTKLGHDIVCKHTIAMQENCRVQQLDVQLGAVLLSTDNTFINLYIFTHLLLHTQMSW